MITFIYSVKYLLNTGDASLDKMDTVLAPMELTFWCGDIDNQNICI